MDILDTEEDLLQQEEEVYDIPCIDRLRFILMIFFMIGLFGFPSDIGGYVSVFSGFAAPAFFIISGYLVLWNADLGGERIVRAIRRTAIAFFALFAAYLLINLISDASGTLSALSGKRFWFDFIVLNSLDLPIGTSIWYIQALLYAYIIIWVLDRLKLMRFDWLIMILCFAVSVVLGELAGVTGIHLLGNAYIGSNWLTRALPYILLGGLIHRKEQIFANFSPLFYIIIAAVGAIAIFAEQLLLMYFGVLVYYGHLFGMGVFAAAVCTLTILHDAPGFSLPFMEAIFAGPGTNALYYICEAVYIPVCLVLKTVPEVFMQFAGLITVAACIVIAAVLRGVQIIIAIRRENPEM